MLCSDWLSYYSAICYNLLVGKSTGVNSSVNSSLIWPSASWAIDSEPIWARGIIDKYTSNDNNIFFWGGGASTPQIP